MLAANIYRKWRNLDLDTAAKPREKKIKINVSIGARNLLAEKGFDPDFGVRPLKRTIQQLVLDPLAKMMVEGKVKEGDKVKVDVKGKEITIESRIKKIKQIEI